MEFKRATRQGVKPVTIPLTHGLVAWVSPEDGPGVLPFKWSFDRIHNTDYAVRMDGKNKVYMHRQILGFPKSKVDHRNRIGLDNQRDNLRVSTGSQNGANSRKKGWSSQYKGVGRDAARGLWRAQIKVNYETRFLGRFASEADAARAYDSAALEAWGEFATLNFPSK